MPLRGNMLTPEIAAVASGNLPALAFSELPADPELVFNGCWPLLMTNRVISPCEAAHRGGTLDCDALLAW